jgi:hypothetical protein
VGAARECATAASGLGIGSAELRTAIMPARDYRFWTKRGFIHVDTIDPLPGWKPGNPCAILVAPLASSR